MGSLLGVTLGGAVVWAFNVYGVNMGQTQAAGVGFDADIYPYLTPVPAVLLTLFFVFMTMAVALGTAVRAGRIQPAAAMRDL